MKKGLCALLALALILMGCASALAAEGDAMVGRGDDNTIYCNYGFALGDTYYMVGYSNLYSYRVGDADVVELYYELPETALENVDIAVMPFAAAGGLYAVLLTTVYDEITQFKGAQLARLSVAGDGAVSFDDLTDIDWSDMVEYYDESSYPTRPDCIVGVGSKAFLHYYGQSGDYQVSALDVNSGRVELLSELNSCYAFTPYANDTLLVEQYDYNESDRAKLLVYDPADGSLQPLASVEVAEYSPLSGLAYDAASDTLYCAKGGEVCQIDLQNGEVGQGVTDMPLEMYGGAGMAVVLEGGFYACCAEGAVIRNLDPGQRATRRLKVNDTSWSDSVSNACYRFANTHGDVSMVLSRDYSEYSNLIENMMNRDDSIDIYVQPVSGNIYDALYHRGYLMELDGSEKLRAMADGMYPSLREALSSNGHLVALPVSAYAYTMGVNEKALEALGLKLEDVPTNWMDFLDFLPTLKDKLESTNGVKLFYSSWTSEDVFNDLFTMLFEDYQRHVNIVDPAMGYNTELLRSLLHKLEQVDFVALGCAEPVEDEDEDGGRYIEYGEELVLLQTSVGCSIGNYYSDFTPILMSLTADQQPYLVLDTTVAFINPYTKNPQEALEFMEELADNMNAPTLYCFNPSYSEPVRGKWNEESIADTQKALDDMNAELEKADAADRQMLEETIRDMQESLDYAIAYGWEISPREVEWYRANDDNLAIAGVNWLYSGDNGEAWDLISQYRAGNISVEEMLVGIDRKVQMMLLEGN